MKPKPSASSASKGSDHSKFRKPPKKEGVGVVFGLVGAYVGHGVYRVRWGATGAWRDHSHPQTPSSPSGDIGSAPCIAGCSAGASLLALLEEETWSAQTACGGAEVAPNRRAVAIRKVEDGQKPLGASGA